MIFIILLALAVWAALYGIFYGAFSSITKDESTAKVLAVIGVIIIIVICAVAND